MNKTPTGLMAAKRMAVAVAAVCATLAAPAYAADDVKNVLDLMLKKGVISQQDYDQFMKDNADAAENKQFKEKRIDDDVTKSVKFMQKRDKDGAVKESGFGLVSADGQHSVNLTGRLHFDSRFNSHDFGTSADRDTASLGNNFEVRRARIGLNGTVFKDIAYEFVTNAVGSDANLIDTAWANYGFNSSAQIRVGRFKQPFSLEEQTSSNNIDFMERSYVNQMTPGKKLGVMIHGAPMPAMTYGLAAYQNGFNQVTNQNDNGREFAGRLTYNFGSMLDADSVLHLGVGGTAGKYEVLATSSGNTTGTASSTTRATLLSFRSENRGLANIYRAQLDSASLFEAAYGGTSDEPMVVDKRLGGLEGAYSTGPFKVQSEYVKTSFDASTSIATGSGDVNAYYVGVLYNLTGESWTPAYKSGAFGGIKPNSNFTSSGGTGAWQVGVRYSKFDATELSTTGTNARVQNSSIANTMTYGLNWLLNPNARVMLNYSVTKFNVAVTPLDVSAATSADSEHILSIRTQLNF
jgi:phosphate-selective porin OprO/OprP